MRRLAPIAALCGWATLALSPCSEAQTPAAPTGPAPSAAPAANAPAQMSPPDAWLAKGTAEVIVLDKLRAQPVTLTIKTGQTGTYGSLTIAVKSCQARPPDLPQNSAAFLEIADSRGSAAVFDGWILSNTPAISQFEHPVYDVRLAACR